MELKITQNEEKLLCKNFIKFIEDKFLNNILQFSEEISTLPIEKRYLQSLTLAKVYGFLKIEFEHFGKGFISKVLQNSSFF